MSGDILAIRDCSKSERVSPAVNARASRAAWSMSSRYATSRHIERPPVAKDVLATKIVVAPLYRSAEYEVHWSTEQLPQLLLHPHQHQERWPTILKERDEYIDIAVRAEVIAQR